MAQGPKKESGTSDEKDETRRRLCDLGTWLGRVNELTDREKYMALTHPFVPPRHFKFPVGTEYGKERRCQESYLNEFDRVVYSQSLDSLLCKYCILFDNGSSSQSCFIKEGFSTWTKARNRLNEHFKGICSNEVESKGAQNSKKRKRRPKAYQNHLDNHLKALNFVRRMEGSLYTADLLMQKDRQEKLERNTKVLDSVIDTIYTSGSQNMPLRGHRDDSKYYDDKGNNPGNFQVMLEYCARSGDTVLAEHLKRTKENNGGRNCTYRSKTIQNEVIKCFEQELRGIIISEVKQAKFFSVMANECSDVANKEQLAIVIRYVNEDDEICEDFVEFVECENGITGLALAEKIKSALQDKYGPDMINLRGQCYNGAGNMSGVRNGLAARVTQEFPKAVYTWCSSHKLNLCVVKSCDITEVRNMIDKATEVAIFFNYSPQRQRAFEEQIEIYCKENEQDTKTKSEKERRN